ncbi:MAG: hypothetical protein L6R38_007473 [Xanthoria sp. 2 TBL-2021]|nr:MAG: hypothetical protein L6R38_007473 [Xanthoria sp. 2 TBL-2021]
MSIEALCEAVSINIGDTERDKDSIPDELEILRWCSSLVRKGVGRDCLELAHFTVKGFLLQLDDNDTGEFSAYRIGPSHDENELAMVCLIYLNFRDFDQGIQGVYMDMAVTERRFKDYPLRRYAVYHWHDLARPRLADHELFSLAKQLLNPTKTGTLLSMLQDWTILWIANSTHIYGQWWLDQVKRAIAEATTLHFAAMFSLPEVCTWLTDSGDCDINRVSGFGTPLHCSLMTLGAIELFRNEDWLDPWEESWGMEEQDRVLEILLAAGADPNYYQGTLSPLFVSLKLFNYDTASQLIDKGARLDERCLKLLESFIDKIGDNDFIDEEIKGVMDRIQCQTVDAKNYSRILKVAKKFRSSGTATGVPGINKAKQFTKSGFESILRAAAEFGQMEVINQIIGGQSVDLGAAEEETGLTALHYAAMNDHLNVVKLLLSRGANPYEADCEGRNAIHHAIHSVGVQCLEHFLESISIDILLDVQGLSLWHWAATNQTKQALVILAKYSTPMPSLGSMRTKDGWSPLLSAASVGSAENIDWLLRAGCTTMDKAYDGSTALHLAARSGFSDAVRVLLRNGSEVSAVTDDGSTVLHFALLDLKEGISPVLKLLIEQGLDVSHAREDGVMPIHLLISHCANMTLPNENDDHGDLNGQPQSLFVWEKRWLLDAFGILARVTDFARKNCAGKSTLHLLADMWEKSDSTLSTTMMNIAMDKVLLTEVPQSLCIDPSYTIKALIIRDEELAYKFLKFFPDVDAVAGDSSIIKAACLNGCSSILLQELLSRSKIQSENKQFSGLVRAACRARPTESRHKVMEVLMNAGLSPNDSCPSSGETPLMIAACQGDTKVLEVLLSSGADIHALNRDGCNVTHFACMGGFLGILQILQKITIDWSRRGSGWIADEFSTGLSPLHLAAIHESSHALEFLLDENLVTDIDVVTDRSFTALSLAGLRARPQNVSLLLSRDADPAIRSFYGETPLQIAIRSGNEAVIREFLQYNRDLDFRGLDYGILLAKKYCHSSAEKMLKEYKEEQGDSLTRERVLASALMAVDAALYSTFFFKVLWVKTKSRLLSSWYFKVLPLRALRAIGGQQIAFNVSNFSAAPTSARVLIDSQIANPLPQLCHDQQDNFRRPTILKTATPLQVAAHYGDLRIARLLLESRASPNSTDSQHRTPLYFAAGSDQPAMIELLLDHGANLHVVDTSLVTPSMIAARYGCWASLQVLKARGADFQMRDMMGRTVLQYAAEPPNAFIVPVIALAVEENLGFKDCMGWSPLADVLYRGNWRTILSILNFAPKLGDYDLHAVDTLSAGVSNAQMSTSLLKKFIRRLSPSIVTILLKHRAQAMGTPLYVASTVTSPSQQEDFISLLLEAGAGLEQLGGEHGTPLMGACAAGRLTAVKSLVGKGARLCYEGNDGLVSALNAARHFPEIVRWLLVERFTHGPRRILSTFDG